MQKYQDLGHTIGRFKCVSLSSKDEESYDRCLAGEQGEIWVRGEGTLKAFKALPAGVEKIFSFEFKDLSRWILRLKVPGDTASQIYWANNPSARHKAV